MQPHGSWVQMAPQNSGNIAGELSSPPTSARTASEKRYIGRRSLNRREVLDDVTEHVVMEKRRHRLSSDPDGNLYRGWAVGIQSGLLQFSLTILVVIAQTIGPVIMVVWGQDILSGGKAQRLDQYLWALSNATSSTQKVATSFSEGHPCLMVILMKLFGMALMMILYFNGELLLSRMDKQSVRMRLLFGKTLRCGWMWVDAFANSWCIAICGCATPLLIWGAVDVKDLCLDAFGLLFLSTLDEYSMSIEYGIETSDFDQIIEERELFLERAESRGNLKRASVIKMSTDHEEMMQNKHLSFVNRCMYGEIWLWFGRGVNLTVGSLALTSCFLFKWIPKEELSKNPWMKDIPPLDPISELLWSPWVVVSAVCIISLVHGMAFRDWLAEERDEEFDFFYFFYRVGFRGNPVDEHMVWTQEPDGFSSGSDEELGPEPRQASTAGLDSSRLLD